MTTTNEQLDPVTKKMIKKLHRQMARDEAAGGVTPATPIKSRVTGKLTHFGPRRSFDGAYIIELLSASGVTPEQAATCVYVLQPLIDVGFVNLTTEDVHETLSLLGGMIGERPSVIPPHLVKDDAS